MINLQDFYTEIEYGEFENIENYGAIKALNSSSLKKGEQSPLHIDLALQGKLNPKKKEYAFGSEFHYMLFEPELFDKLYYFSPKHLGKRSKIDEQDLLREKISLSKGRNRIDLREGEKMKRMADSLHLHPGIRELIEKEGIIEQTLIWKDSDFEINSKGRIDKLIDGNFIIDLKTTKDSSEFYFKKDFNRYLYALQASFYLDGYKTLYPEKSSIEFVFIVIDKEEPYLCEIYGLKEKTINDARDKYKTYIKNYIEYKKNPSSLHSLKIL